MEEKGAVRLRGQRKFAPSFLRNTPVPLSIQPLRRYNRPNISVLLSESKRKTSPERLQRRASCIKAMDSAITPALGVGWELIPLFPSHVSRLSPAAHSSSRVSSSHARVSIRNVRFQEDIRSVLLRSSNPQAMDIDSRQSPDGVTANYPSPTPSYRRLPRKILPEKSFFPSNADEFPLKPNSLPPKLFQNASLRALAKSTISTSSKQQ